MARKKKDTMEFRFYEVPQGEAALILYGKSWERVYGHDEFHLHFHNLMEIGICRYGEGDMHLDNEIARYEEGTYTIIPENFPHITISDGENENFWEYIFFDIKELVKELFQGNPVYQTEIIESLSRGAIISNRDKEKSIANLIDEIIDEARNKKSFYQKIISYKLKALVLEIIRSMDVGIESDTPSNDNNMPQIAAALDYINKYYNKQMKACELSNICNMSETHFRRVFEEYINMAPMDYVNLVRVQKACEIMKKGNDSMDVVAVKCGFTTTSTFNRNFKKFLGISPYQWKIHPQNYEHRLLNYNISALKGW